MGLFCALKGKSNQLDTVDSNQLATLDAAYCGVIVAVTRIFTYRSIPGEVAILREKLMLVTSNDLFNPVFLYGLAVSL